MFQSTTKILLLDTWLFTHGFADIAVLQQYFHKFFKLILLALILAVAAYSLSSMPRLYKKTARPITPTVSAVGENYIIFFNFLTILLPIGEVADSLFL